MNAHTHMPKTLDGILDELSSRVPRMSSGTDAMAQRIVEGTVKDAPPRKSERFGDAR